MQSHAFARALIEDGGKVGRTHQLRVGDAAAGWKFEQELIGIERVDAARSPGRLLLEQRQESRSVLDKSLAHGGQHLVTPCEFIEPIEMRALALHRGDQVVGRKPLVGPEIEDEANETVEVEIVGRHAGDNMRRRVRGLAPGPDMAGAAIEPDDVNALHLATRDADRQVALLPVRILLVQESKSGIVVAACELGWIEARQRLPQPVGQAAVRFGADRAVHEMLCVVAIGRSRLAAELDERDGSDDNPHQPDKRKQDANDRGEVEQPHAPTQSDLDCGEGGVDVTHRDITALVGVTSPPWTR